MPFINKLKKKPRRQTDKRKERMKYYNNPDWKRLRLAKLSAHPTCEICEASDRITLADQVHHIISFMENNTIEEKYRLFFDYENLMSICQKCHGEIHALKQKNAK